MATSLTSHTTSDRIKRRIFDSNKTKEEQFTEPRTKLYILLGYQGNSNYRILLENGRIIGTSNAEFHEVLVTPSTQTMQGVGAKKYDSPVATAAAPGSL